MRKDKFIRWVPKLTYGRVVGGAALLLLASAGTAYAANEWTGANIVNNSLTSADYANDDIQSVDIKNAAIVAADLAPDSVNSLKIANASVTSQDILNATITAVDLAGNSVDSTKVVDGSLSGADIATNSVPGDDIEEESITTFKLQTDSVEQDEVLDFSLTNQDVQVYFGQMNNDGTMAGSYNGSVTGFALGTGIYEMDFGFDISGCGFTATLGAGNLGTPSGQISVADRNGNANAVFVQTEDSAGNLANQDYTVTVVC